MESFIQWKKQCLNKIDLSKKGSVDEDITHIVSVLNNSDKYFTTSSCSGRIILIDVESDNPDVQKQNCSWLFVTHKKCEISDLVSALHKSRGDAVLKFEPFLLHVQCRQLEDGQLLYSVAVNSGFRNSGLTVGNKGKIITAVRSTHGLEVPLSHKGQVLVNQDYIQFLAEVANRKMDENLKRIERFYECLQSALIPADLQRPLRLETGEESVYKRRRKRGQKDAGQETREITPVEQEDCMENGLDLFT